MIMIQVLLKSVEVPSCVIKVLWELHWRCSLFTCIHLVFLLHIVFATLFSIWTHFYLHSFVFWKNYINGIFNISEMFRNSSRSRNFLQIKFNVTAHCGEYLALHIHIYYIFFCYSCHRTLTLRVIGVDVFCSLYSQWKCTDFTFCFSWSFKVNACYCY